MIVKDEVGNGILSKKIVKKYNYSATRKKIDELMIKIEEFRYRIHSIQPPSITPSYEIRYESNKSSTSTSKVENYVTRLLDLEQEAENLYLILNRALSKLCKSELYYFKATFYDHIPEEEICGRLFITIDQLRTIKTSCILKLGMEFDVCVDATVR